MSTSVDSYIRNAIPSVDSRVTRELKTVLHERIGIPLPQVHLRNTCLPLPDGGQPKQQTRERGTGPIVGCGLYGEAIGELVEASILKEAPHRPDARR